MSEMDLKQKNLFISYGHDCYYPLAKRLAEDLRLSFRSVWFDENDIRTFHPSWPDEIEAGIQNSDIVLALMTKHAYRRPSGICTNEIVYASNKNKIIRPILVEAMEVPLLLCTIQYFPIQDVYDSATGTFHEIRYREKLTTLLAELSAGKFDFKGFLHDIKTFLSPQNNFSEICRRTENFVGRQWLFKECNQWIEREDSRILFILGKPGCGKSSFLSKFALQDARVKGIHYCRYNDRDSCKVTTIVKTIAYYLLTQVPQYDDFFGTIDLQSLTDMSSETLFRILIAEPLSSLESKEDVIITIDAVDEMPANEARFLLRILSEYRKVLPKWFKLIFTSRPNPNLLSQINSFNPVTLNVDCSENIKDLNELISASAVSKQLSANEVAMILEKSENIIQYVHLALSGLEHENNTLFNLPIGLEGIYQSNFERFFDNADYSDVRQVLQVVCAAKEPLTMQECCEICGDYAVSQALSRLNAYLSNQNGTLRLFHKSLYDWLLDLVGNPEFCISLREGNRLIAQWARHKRFLWNDNTYLMKYGFAHLFLIRDLETISELLRQNSATISTSFIEFLFQESLFTENVEYLRAMLPEVLKSVLYCEPILARAIKIFVERAQANIAINLLINPFLNNISWLNNYLNLCAARLSGTWTGLIEIGTMLMTQIKDTSVLLEIYDYMGDAYRLTGDHENAFTYYLKAINGIAEHERADKCFFSLYNYYDLRYVKGFLQEATSEIRKYEHSVRNDPFKAYKLFRLLGNIHFQKGEIKLAQDYFEKTLALAKESRRPYSTAEALYSVAECLIGVDDKKAQDYIDESRKISQTIHSEYNYAKTYFASVELLVSEKRYEEAIAEGLDGINRLTKVGYLTGAARIWRNLAEAYYQIGEYEKAIQSAFFPLKRYQSRGSYPIARLKSFLIILKSAKRLGNFSNYRNADDVNCIQNLTEFPNAETYLLEITELLQSN